VLGAKGPASMQPASRNPSQLGAGSSGGYVSNGSRAYVPGSKNAAPAPLALPAASNTTSVDPSAGALISGDSYGGTAPTGAPLSESHPAPPSQSRSSCAESASSPDTVLDAQHSKEKQVPDAQ
jgi:hypothetical protein